MLLTTQRADALVFIGIILVYILGLQIDVIDVDASQYASIALEMLHKHEFLTVTNRYENYLDKPPLHFWLSALSYSIFGVSTWSYKLPSFLFALLGMYSTYRFTLIYYTRRAAVLSAMVLGSCQAFFLITNDVRTDTILCCSIALASWHLAAYLDKPRWYNLVLAFVGMSFALLTKGPIGLFVPIFAFGTDILLKRNFSYILRIEWLYGLAIIFLILSPMCYGLYKQYGIEGPKFYFWTQSFGRITGESSWKNDVDPFFLMHSFAWSFLPWTLVFFLALVSQFRNIFTYRFRLPSHMEAITTGGIVLSYLALSRSNYQLPHYIYVILPYAAVITGNYLSNLQVGRAFTGLLIAQLILLAILWIVGGLLSFVVFEYEIWQSVLFGVLFAGLGFLLYYLPSPQKFVYASLYSIICVNFFMNMHIYPHLLEYQSFSKAGKYISEHHIRREQVFFLGEQNHSMDFYAGFCVNEIKDARIIDVPAKQPFYLFTMKSGLDTLDKYHISYKVLEEYDDYHVSKVTLPFLNPMTRKSKTGKMFMIKYSLP